MSTYDRQYCVDPPLFLTGGRDPGDAGLDAVRGHVHGTTLGRTAQESVRRLGAGQQPSRHLPRRTDHVSASIPINISLLQFFSLRV